ncbi:uncharacterized protein LOC125227103 isoform X1 [Leguminivora glycinivorella]|uniref:uncharacterized protein LOC125227103 isoform X1 n=1 Tax=Leguminivora glycinivorella TaxID=1035111 RepID=UPI00200F9425|nr:uncharacterized protein LOC125227103 isoform X1 [Leguminivora glycinivorella]
MSISYHQQFRLLEQVDFSCTILVKCKSIFTTEHAERTDSFWSWNVCRSVCSPKLSDRQSGRPKGVI